MPECAYVGRFAPSPTGPLHFGSLLAALASCLEARQKKGCWLVRIEDLDAPRTVAGAADTILHQLTDYGFEWDGGIVWQSQRLEAYRSALNQLQISGGAYPCACTRREIADSALRAPDGAYRYPGTCRNGLAPDKTARAWRARLSPGVIHWQDAIQGAQQEDLEHTVGDFVLLRADGQFAYQLAVVIDDAWQGITHVVRGADLLDSTARQIHLQTKLACPQPRYAHLPVATNLAGEKLSKQTLAAPLNAISPVGDLIKALSFLGQNPPDELRHTSLNELWAWMLSHWQLSKVPTQRALPLA